MISYQLFLLTLVHTYIIVQENHITRQNYHLLLLVTNMFHLCLKLFLFVTLIQAETYQPGTPGIFLNRI